MSSKRANPLITASLRLNVEAAQRFISHGIGEQIQTKKIDENVDKSNATTTPQQNNDKNSSSTNSDKKISPGKRERSGSISENNAPTKRAQKETDKKRARK